MKKNQLIKTVFILILLFISYDVNAYTSDDYKYRDLCGNYELAAFHSDGSIEQIACFENYEEAKKTMTENGADDLAIMGKVDGLTKIIDANVGLLDLSVNPTALTYFYRTSDMNTYRYTYMDTGSLYGGVDGALLETTFSSKGVWAAKVLTGGCTAWISQEAYEIVPITWIKSTSSYTVTNDSIRHNYVAKIQNDYYGSAGSTIGPKPEMLENGTYYSYDGHYFYSNLKSMIKDYKKGTYENSVNKNNPYYNYYMSLSNHTKTSYSSTNIDEYIRNSLGIVKDAYGNDTSNGSSRLYGKGTFFYYAQEKYGVNAILALSLSRNETGNGRSNLAINKNNGFGLNAVDSNPYEAANWYASFASSILGYASKWVTYGFTHPRDWRYFGPQFGDKMNGMNVNYASDTYWSEKMASNYYSLDKAKGMQDYNYYQLGIVTAAVDARSDSNNNSKFIYTYPEAGDAIVIIGEKQGETVKGNTTWYKVVSDLNIDNNFNEITSGDYNWNSYVYIPAAYVEKINKGKNGYISPSDVIEYKDKDYEYDLYVENTTLKPKVAITTKNTKYYYDSTLQSEKGTTLLQNRYVMVYTAAYDETGKVVAYLVTSDYFYDQKDWISADAIKFVNSKYGQVSVDVSGNQYTWVNNTTEDTKATLISGLYTHAYVPVLEEKNVDGTLWYKVPVSLTTSSNEFGWTLAAAPGVTITTYEYSTGNKTPVINATNKSIVQGTEFNELENITAQDEEDGDLTEKITIEKSNININVVGSYEITYRVIDSNNQITTKTITITVTENHKPIINATDKTISINEEFDIKKDVTAYDEEDGNLTEKIEITENTLNVKEAGTYYITYKVVDSYNQTTIKRVMIQVTEENQNTKELVKKNGEFYLNSLTWDKSSKQFTISGYLIILNVNNTEDGKYYLILKNKNTDNEYKIEIDSWTKNVPYSLGSDKENNYEYSWFKKSFSLKDIEVGDYDLYMRTEKGEYYAEEIVSNLFNKSIDRRAEDDNRGYNFKVQLSLKTKQIELNIRKTLITTKTSNTFRNMINNYDDMSFIDNKLYLKGTSYNYDGTYQVQQSITRKLILENTQTFETYIYNIGSTKTGSYKVTSADGKDKTYAWYEQKIDISDLPKGTYSMIVYTKTIDSEDYGEISDIFASINKAETQINNKNYKISLNKQRLNRIELVVE